MIMQQCPSAVSGRYSLRKNEANTLDGTAPQVFGVGGRSAYRLVAVSVELPDEVQTLLDAPSAAVLTTLRRDGMPLTSPVWFRWTGLAFEVVVARGDVKAQHLGHDPRCTLVIFETVPPFRGLEVRGEATLTLCDVTPIRRSIASRYLGSEAGARFAAERASKPGILVQLIAGSPRVWDLADILPSSTGG
jgi:PPOX class probable F420-dependent enzyme